MSQFTNEVLGPLTDTELRATPVPVSGTVNVTEPVSIDDNGASITVDGTVSISGTVATTQGGTPTATITRVAVSTTVATLQASNANRKRLIIHNETGTLFIKLGSGATDTDYSYRLTSNTMVELDFYTGIVTAIKATGSSNAQVTEIA